MVVADVGWGIGRPLLEIASFSDANSVGINSNAYQLERARNARGLTGAIVTAEELVRRLGL